MKPITLSMQAFGPYKEREVIDFTQLHDNGIFVVSGPTGAGKTTIFDAITYALYGTGSGEDRENGLILRSDFAPENLDTEVELIFEIQGSTYKIWRKAKADGSGKKQELHIKRNGVFESAVEKQQVRVVLSKIEELVGLTKEQFNQIVMLPQGEYQKMLTSDSTDKEQIFRKIFKTDRYQQLNKILEEKTKKADDLFKEAEMLQKQYVHEIKNRLPVRTSELFTVMEQPIVNLYQLQEALQTEETFYVEETERLKLSEMTASKVYEQSLQRLNEQKALNEQIREYEKRIALLNELKSQESEYVESKNRFEQAERAAVVESIEKPLLKLQQQYETEQATLQQLEQQLIHLKEQLERVNEQYELQLEKEPEREQLAEKLSLTTALIETFTQLEQKRSSVVERQKQQSKMQKMSDEVQQKRKEQLSQIEEQQVNISRLEQSLLHYEQMLEQKSVLEKQIEKMAEAVQSDEKVQQLGQLLQREKEQYDVADQLYKQRLTQQLSHHASLLAATLYEGEPCPVCGSEHHPNLREEQSEAVDESVMEQLLQQQQRLAQQYFNAKAKYETAVEQFEQIRLLLEEEKLTIPDLPQYKERLQQLVATITQLKENKEQLTLARSQLVQRQEQLSVIDSEYEQFREQYEQQKNALLLEQGQLEQLEQTASNYPFESLQEVQHEVTQLQLTVNKMKQQLEQVREQATKSKEMYDQMTTRRQLLSAQLENQKNELEQLREQVKQELVKQKFTTIEQYEQAKLPIETVKKWQEAYQQYVKEVYALEQYLQAQSSLEGKKVEDLEQLEIAVTNAKQQLQQAVNELRDAESFVLQCQQSVEKLEKNAADIEQKKQTFLKAKHVYDLLRGMNEQKVSFERFVQMGYLEKITEAANERLYYLSNKQYYLVASSKKIGQAQSGLSLNVYDALTGNERDVKSLSGGEKFNASLSLALGMADVIQSMQGSVQIDTMFIDEGFGTLDEESLQKAIETLIELQRTGRTIGIISHVAELKNAIPVILEVRKLKNGVSKTSVVVK